MKIHNIPIESDKDIPENEAWIGYRNNFMKDIITRFRIPHSKMGKINYQKINPKIEKEAKRFLATMVESKIPDLVEIEGYGNIIKKDDILTIDDKYIGYKRDYKVISVKDKKYGITKLRLRKVDVHKK